MTRSVRITTLNPFGVGRLSLMLLGLCAHALGTPAVAQPFELADLLASNGGDGSAGFAVNGIATDDATGYSVSWIGDINSDGLDDVAVGAFDASPAGRVRAGRTYVIFGTAAGFAAERELSQLLAQNGGDGSAGFVVNGIATDDRSGMQVAAAGDINADGVDDFIIAAPNARPGGQLLAGQAYLLFGRSQGFPAEFELASLLFDGGGDASQGVVFSGTAFSSTGTAVGTAGEVNGDGIDDLLIGAPSETIEGVSGAGRTYIVYGRSQGFEPEVALSSLLSANGADGSVGRVINGIGHNEFAGTAAAAAGDLNGDGTGDLAIGALAADQAFVVFGWGDTADAELNLASLLSVNGGDGSAGFVLNQVAPLDGTGRALGATGDVNHDGYADLVIGAAGADPDGRAQAGRAYVLFGRDQVAAAEIDLTTLLTAGGGDGSRGFAVNGVQAQDGAGGAVGAAGDFNADGVDDLLIGAPDANGGSGASYVVFGRTLEFPAELELSELAAATGVTVNGIAALERTGESVGFAGDINADGVSDIIIGAPFAAGAGRAYVVFGQPDVDGDGIGDLDDNCTLLPNPNQVDADGDGFGNLCDADLNGDCAVNPVDLALLRTVFFSTDPAADFNVDGVVNSGDLAIMRRDFFSVPGPSGVASCPLP